MAARKRQMDKQWSSKHTPTTKDRVTIGEERRWSGRVKRFCSTSGIRCVILVTNLMISHEWGHDRDVYTTSGTYSCKTWDIFWLIHWSGLAKIFFFFFSVAIQLTASRMGSRQGSYCQWSNKIRAYQLSNI